MALVLAEGRDDVHYVAAVLGLTQAQCVKEHFRKRQRFGGEATPPGRGGHRRGGHQVSLVEQHSVFEGMEPPETSG